MEREHTVRSAADMAAKLAGEKLGDSMMSGTRLLALRSESFDQRVDGLMSQVERLGDVVTRLQRDGASQHSAGDLSGLKEAQTSTRALAETTGHLREALASPKARGQWGERMADDVLRHAGLVEGVSYRKQTGIAGGSIPDVTFLMPGGRVLHMDVKFPVDNYLRHLEATTDAERDTHAKAFLRDVRGRVKELAARTGYIDADATLDEVLLFIPNESVWQFIHERDPQLIDVALRPEGRALLAGEPLRGAGGHPPGRGADPARPARATRSSSAWPASGSSGGSSPKRSTRSSPGSTPPSAASKTSPVPAAGSWSGSSIGSRTCEPHAGYRMPRHPPSATATKRPAAAPAATSGSGMSPKPGESGREGAA